MLFISPEGRKEALWVEEHGRDRYRWLSVPVWAYGVSVGSIVEAFEPRPGYRRECRQIVRDSAGGTVRVIVASGRLASEVYRMRVIPDAKRLGLYVGPATFFNPRLVAVHVHEREKWWPEVGGYLDMLVEEGVLEQWEVADPDQYASEHQNHNESDTPSESVLEHPLPVDGIEDRHVS